MGEREVHPETVYCNVCNKAAVDIVSPGGWHSYPKDWYLARKSVVAFGDDVTVLACSIQCVAEWERVQC